MDTYELPDAKVSEDRGKYKEIANTSDVRVIQLYDLTAARFWGRRTKWCTSANKNNQFQSYFDSGPLYVVIPKNPEHVGEKYQFWWDTDSDSAYNYQYMDEQDENVNADILLDKMPSLKHIFRKLQDVIWWKDNPTEKDKITAAQTYNLDKKYYADASPKLQLILVNQQATNIKYINNPCEQAQLMAVKANRLVLPDIKNPSDAVKLAAYKQSGWILPQIKNPTE
jgi:hypothetical protein